MNVKSIRHILFRVILPHLTIVLSGMLIVLLAIDRVNSSMMFIDHRITKGLMTVLAVASIVNGASLLLRPRHHAPEHHSAPDYASPADYTRPADRVHTTAYGRPSDYTRPADRAHTTPYGRASDYARPASPARPSAPGRPTEHSRPGSGRTWM